MQKRITLNTKNKMYIVDCNEILYCQSSNSSTTLFIIDSEPITVSKSLTTLKSLLDSDVFFQPHQSFLVNRKHIVLIDKTEGYELVLTDHSRIPISVRKRKSVMQFIEK